MKEEHLSHTSMSNHVPNGSYVALHSLCVSREWRRRGVGSGLLREYLERVRTEDGVKGVRLITHEDLRKLYEGVGFQWRGKSEVVHGGKDWFEMSIDFEDMEEVMGVRNSGKVWRGLEGMRDERGMNRDDLYCPRRECRCLLLKAGVGKWMGRPRNDVLVSTPLLMGLIEGETDVRGGLSYRHSRDLLEIKSGR